MSDTVTGYPEDVVRRFWTFTKRVENGCLEWQGARHERGYGLFSISHRKMVRAHRFAVELDGRGIPEGFMVTHNCDNPPCVEATHLVVADHAKNMRDREARGRVCRGEKSPHAKLTAEIVREIRASAEGARPLAARLGVARSLIQRIRQGKHWNHV